MPRKPPTKCNQPEMDAALADKERLDWLESNIRSTGRGNITINPQDYNASRCVGIVASWETTPEFKALSWPDTRGNSSSLRKAIDVARAAQEEPKP